jgi:hypothetical protein
MTSDDTDTTQDLLDQRAKTHGNYMLHAEITQDLKRTIGHYISDWDKDIDDDMHESLDMIAHKIGRIIAGNPSVIDHWADIAGYAQLVANRLKVDGNGI